jgi:hypothetical protein
MKSVGMKIGKVWLSCLLMLAWLISAAVIFSFFFFEQMIRPRRWKRLLGLLLFLLFLLYRSNKSPAPKPQTAKADNFYLQGWDKQFTMDQQYDTPSNQDKIFHDLTTIDRELLLQRELQVTGFEFCSILDGSKFDTLLPIKPFLGSIAEKNPKKTDFINMIDSKAYDIYIMLMRTNHNADPLSIERLSCFTAAQGHSSIANLTYSRLLTEVGSTNYFEPIIPSIIPTVYEKKRYKMAYLVMAHDHKGFEQLKKLLQILDDGDAITLIHVDAKAHSNSLHTDITRWVELRKELNPECAIYMAKTRFHNVWGHISLVFTQLSGFWELLDMADWDYIVNLSNYDFPLKRSKQIHQYLSQPKYMNKNFVRYWSDSSI